jgi:23S rRNA (uracil1939-C5)-methyltransferase
VGKSTNSAQAAAPACSHRPPCPGCPRFGADGVGTHATRLLAALARDAGIDVEPVIEGAPWRFRSRARLAVRGRVGTPKIGIFEAGSHRVVDIPRCPIHHPRINEVAAIVKAGMRALRVPPYADRPHRGLVRYLQVAIEPSTARAQVVLVANDRTPDALAALADHVASALGDRLHGLWWNGNSERHNVILGTAWHRWCGEEMLVDRLGGVEVFFPPGAFRQSNATVLGPLVEAVQRGVASDARVLELYAGTGPLGLGLLSRVRHLTCNEASPHGLRGLERGVAARPAEERARATIVPGPAAAHLDLVATADVVVADPPRRGLDPEVRDALARSAPARVVLVACDVDAFARDARALVAGGLRVRSITPIAAFRFTDQVETVAVFDRA